MTDNFDNENDIKLKSREAFVDEAAQAWAEYSETGLQLAGQEVWDWSETWGTTAEVDLPSCHS